MNKLGRPPSCSVRPSLFFNYFKSDDFVKCENYLHKKLICFGIGCWNCCFEFYLENDDSFSRVSTKGTSEAS